MKVNREHKAMKHIIVLLLVSVAMAHTAFSQHGALRQDTVIKLSGDVIIGKITEVGIGYIVCQLTDSTLIVNHMIAKENVLMLKYGNGIQELVKQDQRKNTATSAPNPKQIYSMGQNDARNFYKGNGAMWGTAGSTVLFPPLGLVEGIVSASIPPTIRSDQVDPKWLKDLNYVAGYRRQAHRKKVGKVATGFAIGIGVYLVAWAVIVGATTY